MYVKMNVAGDGTAIPHATYTHSMSTAIPAVM